VKTGRAERVTKTRIKYLSCSTVMTISITKGNHRERIRHLQFLYFCNIRQRLLGGLSSKNQTEGQRQKLQDEVSSNTKHLCGVPTSCHLPDSVATRKIHQFRLRSNAPPREPVPVPIVQITLPHKCMNTKCSPRNSTVLLLLVLVASRIL
jgi:hypothetical protein